MKLLGPTPIQFKSATISRIIYGSASLDFPSTIADGSSDRTITVTGAEEGDFVLLGIPPAAMPAAGGVYRRWVSAANTVTIRFYNNTGSSINPGSGTFKVAVIKAS